MQAAFTQKKYRRLSFEKKYFLSVTLSDFYKMHSFFIVTAQAVIAYTDSSQIIGMSLNKLENKYGQQGEHLLQMPFFYFSMVTSRFRNYV
jgi:hypothetical protein